jgi:hypothetical protein
MFSSKLQRSIITFFKITGSDKKYQWVKLNRPESIKSEYDAVVVDHQKRHFLWMESDWKCVKIEFFSANFKNY